MNDVDADTGGEPIDGAGSATSALEQLVDPVVSVDGTEITYANTAAREQFDLPADPCGKRASTMLGSIWDCLEGPVSDTTAGTARQLSLEDDRFDARIHRGVDGATIVFTPTTGVNSPADDDRVKARAVNEAPVGVAISDPDLPDNPLVYVNRTYQEITGYGFEEMIGKNCRVLQGPDSDPDTVATMRDAIDDERPVTVEIRNYRKDGSEFWNEVTIAPVRDDEGAVTHYVGFQNDITARKEAELEVTRRTAELEYILDRVEGLMQDVTAVVAGSTSRTTLETEVCERIAREDAYDGVWIGERNPATNTIEIRAQTGTTTSDLPADGNHPASTTLTTGEPTIAGIEGKTVCSFPLVYNDIEYGVLTVCADSGREIDAREKIVLSALTRAVASGINARETSRSLTTDAIVAVEIEVADPSIPVIALAQQTDAQFEYKRSVHHTEDDTRSLFSVTGATAADIEAAGANLEGVTVTPVVDRGDGCLIEMTSETDLVHWLSERGVRTAEIDIEDGQARLTLEIPRSGNVRSIVEAIESRYTGTDVRSFEQREREHDTQTEFVAKLEDDLTARQYKALQRAYLGGYFEWPRPTTGEELASSMDVSRPTFHEHLRSAEQKLCRALFEDRSDQKSSDS